jgi:predicted MFS family arabinose efflux permease
MTVAGLEPSPVAGEDLGPLPPAVLRLVGVAFVALVAFSGFEGTFALLVEDRFGLTLSSTGAVFTVIGLALVSVQVGLIHTVNARLGEAGTLRLGLAANAAGLLLLAVDGGWVTLVPALGLLVLGQGLVTPTMSSAVAARVPADRRGEVLGFQQSAGSLARVAGPASAGVLFQHVGVPAPYLVAGVLVMIAVAFVPRRS